MPLPPTPFLPADLEDEANGEQSAGKDWHPRVLRELARQLGTFNDFYFPLIGAAQILEAKNK